MENEVTYFFFLSHTKNYLKQLITNPSSAEIDDEFKSVLDGIGVSQEEFLSLLLEKGIIERKEKVDDDIYKGHEKATFSIKYQVPRKNFERKIQKLHIELFPDEKVELNEEGEGGGATSADASGQFIQSLVGTDEGGSDVIRRKIYMTREQFERIQEAVEVDNRMGEFGYDAPGLAITPRRK